MSDLESAARYLRYQIDSLIGRNAHHEFEHLCRRVAEARIASNVLPATGPVSSGGDQGRDFETHPTDLIPGVGGAWQRRASGNSLVFCCTLQREDLTSKIKRDVAKVCSTSGFTPDRVHYFLGAPMPSGRQHELAAWAQEECGTELVVHDQLYLAEQLSQPDLVWVAQRYLDLPEQFVTVPEPSSVLPEWYERSLRAWKSQEAAPLESVAMELADCLRWAALNRNGRDDVAFWIDRLAPLTGSHDDVFVQQIARHEIVFAHYTSLGSLRPVDSLIVDYLRDSVEMDEPETLRNAAMVLQYASAARVLQQTDLTTEFLEGAARALTEHVAALLDRAEPKSSRLAMLLHVQAQLNMHVRFDFPPAAEATGLATVELDMDQARADSSMIDWLHDAAAAVASWKMLAEQLNDETSSGAFPVGHLSSLVVSLTPAFQGLEEFRDLTRLLDDALANQAGQGWAARACMSRGDSLKDAGFLVEAAAEFADAVDRFGRGGLREGQVLASIKAAYVLHDLGLHEGAEFYGLTAAIGCTRSTDTSHRKYVATALATAAQAEFGRGAWLGAFELSRWCLLAHVNYAFVLTEEQGGHLEAARDYLSNLLVSSQSLLGPELAEHIALESAPFLGLSTDQALDFARRGGELSSHDWDDKTVGAISSPPFQDLGPTTYEVSFSWRSTSWRLHTAPGAGRATTMAVDRLAAAFQLMLLDLDRTPMGLPPTQFDVEVVLRHSAEDERPRFYHRTPSNWEWQVFLTDAGDASGQVGSEDVPMATIVAEAATICSWILAEASIAPTLSILPSVQAQLQSSYIDRMAGLLVYDQIRKPFEDPDLRARAADIRRPIPRWNWRARYSAKQDT